VIISANEENAGSAVSKPIYQVERKCSQDKNDVGDEEKLECSIPDRADR